MTAHHNALATSVSIGERLLKVLGLEGQHVKRVLIDVQATDIVNVMVERYATDDQVGRLLDIVEVDNYKLVRHEEPTA